MGHGLEMRSWALAAVIFVASPAVADVSGVPVVTDGDTLRIGEARIRIYVEIA